MPTDLNTALAHHRNREAARFANWSREATRTRGACHSGLTVGEFDPATDAELEANARADVRKAHEFAASPEGRFLHSVKAVERSARATGDAPLHAAACRALACANRGVEGDLNFAANCLTEIELCGGVVVEARAALGEFGALQMAAE